MTDVKPHRFDLRVYYEDTDAGGIVYHANYLRFAERARTEMLREVGVDHQEMLHRNGIAFAVRRCNVEYLAPARLDDGLCIVSSLTHLGGASMDIKQIITRGDQTLCMLKVRLACMQIVGNKAGRPARIPDVVRDAMAPYAETMAA